MVHILKIRTMSKEKEVIHLFKHIIKEIDCGNSKVDEDGYDLILDSINKITNTKNKLSKYQACQKLGISRATFDNRVKEGKIPKGRKEPGFKELFWYEQDLQ